MGTNVPPRREPPAQGPHVSQRRGSAQPAGEGDEVVWEPPGAGRRPEMPCLDPAGSAPGGRDGMRSPRSPVSRGMLAAVPEGPPCCAASALLGSPC